MTDTKFTDALEGFRAAADEILKKHFADSEFTFAVPFIEIVKGGPKYAKLFRGERDPKTGERWPSYSVHSLVSRETGEIFMPAGPSRPAKHARGSIYENNGRDSLTQHGSVKYLR
jgi:hypothetical protein